MLGGNGGKSKVIYSRALRKIVWGDFRFEQKCLERRVTCVACRIEGTVECIVGGGSLL